MPLHYRELVCLSVMGMVFYWCIHLVQSSWFILFLGGIYVPNVKLNCRTALKLHCGCINADRQSTTEVAVQVVGLTKDRLKKKNQKGSCWSALTWLSASNKIYALRGFFPSQQPRVTSEGCFHNPGKHLNLIISNYPFKWSYYTILTIFISFLDFFHTFFALQKFAFLKCFLCSLFLPRHSTFSHCIFRTLRRIWGKCRKCQWALIFLSLCLGCSDCKPVVPVGGSDNVLKSLNPAAHTHWQSMLVTGRRPNAGGNLHMCNQKVSACQPPCSLSGLSVIYTPAFCSAGPSLWEARTCRRAVCLSANLQGLRYASRAVNLYLVCIWVVTSSWPCPNFNNVYMRAPGLMLTVTRIGS